MDPAPRSGGAIQMRRPVRPACWFVVALVAGSCGGGDPSSENEPSSAGSPRSATFVERLGSDTFAIESFRRTAEGVQGTIVTRSPETRVLHYRASVSAGRISAYEIEWRPASGADVPSLSRTTVVLEGDSARIRKQTGAHRLGAVGRDPEPRGRSLPAAAPALGPRLALAPPPTSARSGISTSARWPAERFTIEVRALDQARPGDEGVDGELGLVWDRTRLVVPIRVR